MTTHTKITMLILFVMCIVGVLVPQLHADADPSLRKVVMQHDSDTTSIFINVDPGEQVLVAYSEGSGTPAYPMAGINFASQTMDHSLRLMIKTPRVRHNNQWGFMWGVNTPTESVLLGASIQPPAVNEQEIKVRHIQLPSIVDGLELHLFPFVIQGDNMSCMFIAIAKDRDVLKNHVKVQETRHFDWDKSFRTAASFVAPPTDSENEKDVNSGAGEDAGTNAASPEQKHQPNDVHNKSDTNKG